VLVCEGEKLSHLGLGFNEETVGTSLLFSRHRAAVLDYQVAKTGRFRRKQGHLYQ